MSQARLASVLGPRCVMPLPPISPLASQLSINQVHSAKEYIARGDKCWRNGDQAGAERWFGKAATTCPLNWESSFRLGEPVQPGVLTSQTLGSGAGQNSACEVAGQFHAGSNEWMHSIMLDAQPAGDTAIHF